MTEIPLGFAIEETDEGFILRRGDEEIRMSKEEFFSLRLQMNLWTDRILTQFRGRTGEVQRLVSHPIAQAGVWPDAIDSKLLDTLFVRATVSSATALGDEEVMGDWFEPDFVSSPLVRRECATGTVAEYGR